jgi:hypothetical protein
VHNVIGRSDPDGWFRPERIPVGRGGASHSTPYRASVQATRSSGLRPPSAWRSGRSPRASRSSVGLDLPATRSWHLARDGAECGRAQTRSGAAFAAGSGLDKRETTSAANRAVASGGLSIPTALKAWVFFNPRGDHALVRRRNPVACVCAPPNSCHLRSACSASFPRRPDLVQAPDRTRRASARAASPV